METYTVKQIAKMLETNPETVRRWIRTGKLEAIKGASKKEGSIVSEDMLKLFLKQAPKYAAIAASPVTALLTGAMIGTAGIITKRMLDTEQIKNSVVDTKEVCRLISEEIQSLSQKIVQKEKNIKLLQDEIKQDESKLVELKALVESLKE